MKKLLCYSILLILSALYLVCYGVHCLKLSRALPGIGAFVLLLLPGGCAAIFVFILLRPLY